MSKTMDTIRVGAKFLGTASVQMMIGGIVTAVIPPQVSMVYKGACLVGSCLASMAVNKPVSEAVDETFDNIEAQIEETKQSIKILKQKESEVETK